MDKYCRMCWNTSNWRQPTGEARLIEGGESYVADNGFGHEEWLFNFEWMLGGYDQNDPQSRKYGFLQPIGKYRHVYEGLTFSVLLYTIRPAGTRVVVAMINDLYVPFEDELVWVLNRTIENGWLRMMQSQLHDLGIPVTPLLNPSPASIANVRFRLQDVTFYDPMLIVEGEHKITTIHRYHPLDWDDTFPPVVSAPVSVQPPDLPEYDDNPERFEAERTRAGQKATTYDPRHVRLQNRLYRNLCALYGRSSIRYEEGFVDLAIVGDEHVTYIEIKTDLTVKSCIRSALGQLVEYAHYPNLNEADTFLVVGDAMPVQDNITYLEHLRAMYGLPIHYAQWSWTDEELGKWV